MSIKHLDLKVFHDVIFVVDYDEIYDSNLILLIFFY